MNEPISSHYQRHCDLSSCLPWVAGNALPPPEQKTRADGAEQQVNAAQAITSNVLTTMTIFNTIAEANQHAKSRSH